MIFNVSELPYGLRCRLRQLASPVERYQLQVAAGEYCVCPPNLQMLKSVSDPLLSYENSEVKLCPGETVFKKSLTIEKNSLLSCQYVAILDDFDAAAFNSSIFDHLLCDVQNVILQNCDISNSFFASMRSKFHDVRMLSIDCGIHGVVSNLDFVLTVNPKLQSFNIKQVLSSSWVTETLRVQRHSLKLLSYTFCQDLCGTFKFDQLLTFLTVQHQGFQLLINWIDDCEEGGYFSQLKDFLDENLQCIDIFDVHLSRSSVTIYTCDYIYQWGLLC